MRALAATALVLTALTAGCGATRPRKAAVAAPAELPEKAKAIVRTARSYLPEEETPKKRRRPKDCSDFVAKVFAENGIALPRTSVAMSLLGERVASAKDLRMGDLVFFSGEKINRIVGHVGIYINNGIFIHVARPRIGVRMESLYSDAYRPRYLTARRLVK